MDTKILKDLQNVELEILLEVDRICKKNNIKYFLVSGTLLGAIRHKGFIPWDDDIDVCMSLKDYKKFCKVSKKELDSDFFLQNYETDYTNRWPAKMRKNNTTAIEKGFENSIIHQGIWIDIFPIIGVKNNDKWIKKATKRSDFAKKLLRKRFGANSKFKELSFDKKLLRFVPFDFIRMIVKITLSTIFKSHEKYEFCTYLWGDSKISARFRSDVFDDLCDVEFEGCLFPAPKKWDKYLQQVYGDYMTPPPPENRNGGCHSIAIIDTKSNYTNYIKNSIQWSDKNG